MMEENLSRVETIRPEQKKSSGSKTVQGKDLKKEKQSDGVAGRALPAEEKFIDQAMSEFMEGSGDALILPPIPDSVLLKRKIPSTHQLMAQAELLAGHGDTRNSLLLLRQVLAIQSNHIPAIQKIVSLLGGSEFAKKEKEKLLHVLTQLEPGFQSFLEYGKFLYEMGRMNEAQSSLDTALQYSTHSMKDLFEANKLVGNLSVQSGDYEMAEEFYNKAFAIDSKSSALLINMGTLEIQKKSWKLAKERFESALLNLGIHDRANRVKAHIGIFLVERETNEESCLKHLQKALAVDPFHRAGVHLLALWYMQASQNEEAIQVLEKYIEKNPFDEEMSMVLAQFYLTVGNSFCAEQEVEKIALWNPKNLTAIEIVSQISEIGH